MTRIQYTLVIACLALAGTLHAAPVFVNGLAIPGAAGDTNGTSVNNGRLGFFSDLYYDQLRNEWWGLSDRGPGGGTLSYDTRVQRFTLDVNSGTGAISNFQVSETVKFTSGGVPFNGLAPNPTNILGQAFDPEGIVVNPTTGNLYVSDEYGPSLYEFTRTGELVRTFTTPANQIPRDGANVPNFAGDMGNVAGKRTNRGYEGLAISPDGKYTYAMLQSAMLDEGGSNGTINRIVKYDNATGLAVAQYAYQMEGSSQGRGISALVAVNDHEFLVLERNNRGVGVGAEIGPVNKRVYQIDLNGATDISGIDVDAPGAVFTPVSKAATPFLDLAADTLAELGNKSPEKWEGLAVGPRLADNSFLFLAGTDNDYSVTQNADGIQFDVYFRFTDEDPYASSVQCPVGQVVGCFQTSNGSPISLPAGYALLPGVLHAYRGAESDLLNYVTPYAIPEPQTWALLLVGLGGFALRRRMA